jgi:hypothetical protein
MITTENQQIKHLDIRGQDTRLSVTSKVTERLKDRGFRITYPRSLTKNDGTIDLLQSLSSSTSRETYTNDDVLERPSLVKRGYSNE